MLNKKSKTDLWLWLIAMARTMLTTIWIFWPIHAKVDVLPQLMCNNPQVDMFLLATTTVLCRVSDDAYESARHKIHFNKTKFKYLSSMLNCVCSDLYFISFWWRSSSLEVEIWLEKWRVPKIVIKIRFMTKTIVCKLPFMWNTHTDDKKKFGTGLSHVQLRPDFIFSFAS